MSTEAALRRRWPRGAGRALALLSTFAVLLALIAVFSPYFFRTGNLLNVGTQSAMLAILAVGMSVVLLTGGIDLSLPANMALAGIAGSYAMIGTDSVLLGCLVMIAAGTAVGALNGVAVAWLRMIPFVVTLAMLSICSGIAVWVTNSTSISSQPERFFDVFLARPFGIPAAIFLTLAVAGLGQWLTGATVFGRRLYAVGINPAAARIARVPVARTLFIAYAFAGAMAGVAAVVITARLGSASANIGNDSVILDIITACVIGGISIYGGVGRPLGAVFGAVFVLILGNVLNLAGISFFVGLMLKGVIIVAVVAADRAAGER
ncbi:MAG: ABC transporter permease [Jannaschia sp.]